METSSKSEVRRPAGPQSGCSSRPGATMESNACDQTARAAHEGPSGQSKGLSFASEWNGEALKSSEQKRDMISATSSRSPPSSCSLHKAIGSQVNSTDSWWQAALSWQEMTEAGRWYNSGSDEKVKTGRRRLKNDHQEFSAGHGKTEMTSKHPNREVWAGRCKSGSQQHTGT